MTNDNSIRSSRVGAALAWLALAPSPAAAQRQPETVPVAVAQAANLMTPIGPTTFFDERLPDGWPADLVPAGARVLGGSIVGNPAMFTLTTVVLEFPAMGNPDQDLASLLKRAGYVPRGPQGLKAKGGFVATAPADAGFGYCKDDVMAIPAPVDTVYAPRVRSLTLLAGEGGRQNCSGFDAAAASADLERGLPALTPPPGVMQTGGGSSWSGESGTIRTTLLTTMPADSILAHYTGQLAAAGWRADGRPAVTTGAGVQRFDFLREDGGWSGALVVLESADRRQVLLEMARKD